MMLTSRNLINGALATLLLFSLAMAFERIYPRGGDAVIAASQPSDEAGSAARGSSRARASRSHTDDADFDIASDDGTAELTNNRSRSQLPGMHRSPSAKTGLHAAVVASTTSASRSDDGWLRSIATELANALPLGTGATPSASPSAQPVALTPAAGSVHVRDVFFSDSPDGACLPGGRQFTLEELRGLYVCVVWAGAAGTYAQQVTFETPGGHVYQRVISAFDTESGSAGRTVEVDGRAYPVHTVRRSGGRVFVTTLLPVAGTFITQYNMAGVWTVKVSLNGETIGQDTFELVQRN